MPLQASFNTSNADFEAGEAPCSALYSVIETRRWAARALIRCLSAYERLTDRVAAAGNTLSVIVGPDLVLAVWASLHGLA